MDCIENALKITGWKQVKTSFDRRARVKLLARFLTALIVCRSVCLTRIANAFEGEAKTASHYKRLQRFLRGFDLDTIALARIMLGWLPTKTGLKAPYILSLDRTRRQTGRLRETNWKLGCVEINVLMLAIVYRKIAFPLVWMLLGKAGNSSTEERKCLLTRYLEAFGRESIAYITADREFGGKQFASWLSQQKIWWSHLSRQIRAVI